MSRITLAPKVGKSITVEITLSEAMTAVYALRQHAAVETDEKTTNKCKAVAAKIRAAFIKNIGTV